MLDHIIVFFYSRNMCDAITTVSFLGNGKKYCDLKCLILDRSKKILKYDLEEKDLTCSTSHLLVIILLSRPIDKVQVYLREILYDEVRKIIIN